MKTYTLVTVFFLGLIAVLHLLRLILGGEVIVEGIVVPVWTSALAAIFTGGLAFMLYREAKK